MRRTRRLILLILVVIAVSVGIIWNLQKAEQRRLAPAAPPRLPEKVTAQAGKWTWRHMVGSFTKVELAAADFQQISEPERLKLRGVELRIFDSRKPEVFDRVTSAEADFDPASGALFSEGEVEIAMDVPVEAQAKPAGRLLKIRSSGVRFDSKAAKVTTDRPAFFTFDRGEGQSTGADYDSNTRELRLHRKVELKWRSANPADPDMQVHAGHLFYKESDAKVFLTEGSRLTRGSFTLDAAESTVTLAEGLIQFVEARQAHGADKSATRNIAYSADFLKVNFNERGEISTVVGEPNARVESTAPSGKTTITTRRMDLAFALTPRRETVLTKADANGDSVVRSEPADRPGAPAGDTRVLRSETIVVEMRTGGEEIDNVQTHSPGSLEFIPNSPGRRRRSMTGDRMWINYGPQNQIKTFRSINVATRSESDPGLKRPLPAALTSSKDLLAEFDPKTGELAKLEQWNDFKYEEGERRGRAEKAVLDSPTEIITLTGKARVWDPTGSTDADRLVLNQRTGAFEAVGNVASTRLQEDKDGDKKGGEKKAEKPAPMLAGPEPVQARAARMTTSERNQIIRYEEGVVMWQGPNRLNADRVEINRQRGLLHATGKVVTHTYDRGKKPVFTIITAAALSWDDKERLAHYTGGVVLERPALTVNSRELRAWMNESTLERAFADGEVRMKQTAAGRTRIGTGDHGEYYIADERLVLSGESAQLVDTVKGTTRGRQLTWFARDDRLLVEGAESKPAVTNLRRKR